MPPASKTTRSGGGGGGGGGKKFSRTFKLAVQFQECFLESQQGEDDYQLRDTRLITSDGWMDVHAAFISALSPFLFKCISSQGDNYLKRRSILMVDWTLAEIEPMIQLLYTGSVTLSSEEDVTALRGLLAFFEVEIQDDLSSKKISSSASAAASAAAAAATIRSHKKMTRTQGPPPPHRGPAEYSKLSLSKYLSSTIPTVVVASCSSSSFASPSPNNNKGGGGGGQSGQSSFRQSSRSPATSGRFNLRSRGEKRRYNYNDSDWEPDSEDEKEQEEEEIQVVVADQQQQGGGPCPKIAKIVVSPIKQPSTSSSKTSTTTILSQNVNCATTSSTTTTNSNNVEAKKSSKGGWVEPNYKDKAWFDSEARRCQFCTKKFNGPSEASLCITSHDKLRCYFCFKVSSNTEKLFDHFRLRHKLAGRENCLLCPFCDVTIPFKSISCHVISMHLSDSKSSTRKEKEGGASSSNKDKDSTTPTASTSSTSSPSKKAGNQDNNSSNNKASLSSSCCSGEGSNSRPGRPPITSIRSPYVLLPKTPTTNTTPQQSPSPNKKINNNVKKKGDVEDDGDDTDVIEEEEEEEPTELNDDDDSEDDEDEISEVDPPIMLYEAVGGEGRGGRIRPKNMDLTIRTKGLDGKWWVWRIQKDYNNSSSTNNANL